MQSSASSYSVLPLLRSPIFWEIIYCAVRLIFKLEGVEGFVRPPLPFLAIISDNLTFSMHNLSSSSCTAATKRTICSRIILVEKEMGNFNFVCEWQRQDEKHNKFILIQLAIDWSSVRWLLFVCVTALFVCLLDTSYIYTYIRKEEVYLCSMRLLRRRSRSSNKEHRLTLNEEEEKEEEERRRRNEDKGQRWERKEHPYSGSLITQQQQQRPSPRSDSFLVAPQTINLLFLFNLQDDVGYVTAV